MIKALPNLREEILKAAEPHGLDPDLVHAVVLKESAGMPWAVRFEPKWRYFYFVNEHASRLYQSVDTERVMQMTSWGLGQVMGSVAREYGFSGWLPELCDPQTNLKYVCMHLKKFLIKYGNESAAFAAYNGGHANKTRGGMFANQRYVDDVDLILRRLRQIN